MQPPRTAVPGVRTSDQRHGLRSALVVRHTEQRPGHGLGAVQQVIERPDQVLPSHRFQLTATLRQGFQYGPPQQFLDEGSGDAFAAGNDGFPLFGGGRQRDVAAVHLE